jgi:peroxiredoxin
LPSTPSSPEPASTRRRYVALAAICVVIAGGVIAFILATSDHGGSSSATCTVPTASAGTRATVAPDTVTKAELRRPAPDFTLCTVGGKAVRLSQFRGTPVVLTFFASWCYPCRAELPMLEKLQREMGRRLQVVAVSYRDIDFDSRRFVRELGITYPALLEDDANTVAARFGVHAIPMTFFINRNGVISYQTLFGEGSRSAIQPGLDAITR